MYQAPPIAGTMPPVPPMEKVLQAIDSIGLFKNQPVVSAEELWKWGTSPEFGGALHPIYPNGRYTFS
jgi:hypothetical protein